MLQLDSAGVYTEYAGNSLNLVFSIPNTTNYNGWKATAVIKKGAETKLIKELTVLDKGLKFSLSSTETSDFQGNYVFSIKALNEGLHFDRYIFIGKFKYLKV